MIEIAAARPAPGTDEILTPDALAFLADLQAAFGPRREALLGARRDRQAEIDAGADLDFDPATADVRAGDWTVPRAPADLDGPARRDHRTGRAEDDDQRPELRAPGCSWPTSRTRSAPAGRTSSAARPRSAPPSGASSRSTARRARRTA